MTIAMGVAAMLFAAATPYPNAAPVPEPGEPIPGQSYVSSEPAGTYPVGTEFSVSSNGAMRALSPSLPDSKVPLPKVASATGTIGVALVADGLELQLFQRATVLRLETRTSGGERIQVTRRKVENYRHLERPVVGKRIQLAGCIIEIVSVDNVAKSVRLKIISNDDLGSILSPAPNA